jgi:hypothetical protein
MEIKGKLEKIFELKSGTSASGKDWSMQDILLDLPNDKFPKKIVLQTKGCNYPIGSELTCQIDINAREWKEKWYNSITAWKIESNTSENQVRNEIENNISDVEDNDDTLPF